MASNLKRNYIDQGLTTIPAIGAKYAPVGAANDPNKTNAEWPGEVTKIYSQLGRTPQLTGPELTGLPQTQYPTVPLAPTSAAPSAGQMAYEASSAAAAAAPEDPTKHAYETVGKGISGLGTDLQTQGAAREKQALAAMSAAASNVPTSNPLLVQLENDPTAPYRNALLAAQYPLNQFAGFGGYGG
jgi:hypothetical protein